MGITFKHRGNFSKTQQFFNKMLNRDYLNVLDKYGREGCAALAQATPKDSGETAKSWTYEIRQNDKGVKLVFLNTNVQNGVNIAIILQYGHGTRNGGYVQGIDYINPIVQPIMEKIAEEAWREVERS